MTKPRRPVALVLLVLVVLGFALRLPAAGLPPPGLYRDEAYYGLDAAGVLAGDVHLYFPANNGREPLFIYLVAGFVAVLGRTPEAVRLAAAFVGTATIAATAALGAALGGRRVGLAAAALVAFAPWPVLLGRTGLRAGTLPLVLALAAASGLRAARARDPRWAAFAGALAGLTLYTYAAARVGPLAALGLLGWLVLEGRRPERRMLFAWLVGAAAVAVPLGLVFALDPAGTLGRAAQVSIFDPAVSHGDVLGTLTANAWGAARMFFVQGDFIPRHNIPLRPMLGPLAGALWLVGAIATLVRARRSAGAALLVLWTLVFALPTVLAENAPHFLRAVGLLPAVAVVAALGARTVAELVGRMWPRIRRPVGVALVAGAVAGEVVAATRYLVAAGQEPTATALGYAFEAGAVWLARQANDVAEAGWRGGWAVSPSSEGQPVWLDRRLRDGWAAVPYLVATERVTLTDPYDPILTRVPGAAFVSPLGLDLDRLWSQAAPSLRLDIRPGALERGDLEPEARPLYVQLYGTEAEAIATPLARFANGLRLDWVRARWRMAQPVLDVEWAWSLDMPVSTDVTAFVQLLQDDRVIATSDLPLGSDLYGVPRWRVGDRIIDRRTIAVPFEVYGSRHDVIAGIYVRPGTDRVPVLAESGTAADHVTLHPTRMTD